MSFDGERFLRTLLSDAPSEALQQFAADVVWEVPGDPRFGGGVHRGHAECFTFMGRVLELFPHGLAIRAIQSWPPAAGAVAELMLAGDTARGVPYENRYVFVIAVADGRVTGIREYTDTARAERMLGLA